MREKSVHLSEGSPTGAFTWPWYQALSYAQIFD
jgi:hypothetical protein